MFAPFSKIILILTVLLHLSFICKSQESQTTDWLVSDLLQGQSKIEGNPELSSSPFCESVSFDGSSDALFLEQVPIKSLKEFTVEMIFKPEINAPSEQRILHIGEIDEDRLLLEIRAVDDQWYFDGFIASGNNEKALIEPKYLHPLGKWYHVALVVGPESMTTFVDGMLELFEPSPFTPLETGQTAIGVRQNMHSWFKGEIYRIRITPRKLRPEDFISLKP